jgi:DNA-binding IclR family transcriptional regulator
MAEGFRPLKEIAAAAGMPASKAYLYLVSFAREGLVAQDATTGHYGLGPFATQLGLAAIRQSDVIHLSREEVAGLRQATGCAAYLSIWGNRGPTIALKMDGDRQGSMVIRVGYVLPLLHSATGRVFLTYLPSSETDPLLLMETTVATGTGIAASFRGRPRSPAAVVAEVRRHGYASSEDQMINAGFAALSAPIFDYSGRIVAALTVLGPIAIMSATHRPVITQALLAATARVSAKLGYPPHAARSAPEPKRAAVRRGARAKRR